MFTTARQLKRYEEAKRNRIVSYIVIGGLSLALYFVLLLWVGHLERNGF